MRSPKTPIASGSRPSSREANNHAEDVSVLLVELVEQLDAMVAYWDGDQRCRYANGAYKQWFGRDWQELTGISLRELLGPLYAMNLQYIEAAYRGEKQVFERAIPTPDGTGVRHSLSTYFPRVVDGTVQGIFVHVADVEPLKRLQIELRAARDLAEALALRDPLTGLANRRMFADRLAEGIRRAKRTGERIYALSIDIDYFKSVNDTYGHAAGDRLLIEIAARINSCFRDYDTVARIGGDEFCVLVSGIVSDERMRTLVERLLQSATRPIAIGGQVLVPGLSIGVADYPQCGPAGDALLLASDRALYAAKDAGRNCFRFADYGA